MKSIISLLTILLSTMLFVHAEDVKLYGDSRIKAIYEKFVENREDGILKIVPNGETKKVSLIFQMLKLDLRRLGKPAVRGFNSVRFYIWQVSPKWELSIMIASNDPKKDFSDLLRLKGYGVRLQEIK